MNIDQITIEAAIAMGIFVVAFTLLLIYHHLRTRDGRHGKQ